LNFKNGKKNVTPYNLFENNFKNGQHNLHKRCFVGRQKNLLGSTVGNHCPKLSHSKVNLAGKITI